MRTTDFDTFESIPSGQSYTLSVDGPLPFASFTNWAYREVLSTTGDLGHTFMAVGPSGNIMSVGMDAAGSGECRYFNGSSWAIHAIAIPNMVVRAATNFFTQLQYVSDNEIHVSVYIDDGGTAEVHRYVTTDQGATWNFEFKWFDNVGVNIYRVFMPENWESIPPNENFSVMATGGPTDGGIPDWASAYYKEAAFGSIQTRIPATITPYADVDTMIAALSAEWAYSFDDAHVTKAGSVITAITDRSGNAKTPTINGSPVQTGGDTIVFDGTDDELVIPPTGIVSTQKMVLVTVWNLATQGTNNIFTVWAFDSGTGQVAASGYANISGVLRPQVSVGASGNLNIFRETGTLAGQTIVIDILVVDGLSRPKRYLNDRLLQKHSQSQVWGVNNFAKWTAAIPNIDILTVGSSHYATSPIFYVGECLFHMGTLAIPTYEMIRKTFATLANEFNVTLDNPYLTP